MRPLKSHFLVRPVPEFRSMIATVCEKFFWRDGNPLFIVTCVTSI